MTQRPATPRRPWRYPLLAWPLRWIVPLSIIVFTLFLAAYSLGVELVRVERRVEQGALSGLMQRMYWLQNTLQFLMQRQEIGAASRAVRSLDADTAVEGALLIDENGVVLASTQPRDVGRLSDAVLARLCCTDHPGKLATLAQQARTHAGGWVEIVNAGAGVVGVHPVVLGARAGERRPGRVGLLFIQQDLTQAKHAARRDAQQRVMESMLFMFTLAALLWLFFHFTVNRRVTSLVQAVQAFAGGDYGKRIGYHGADELARIAGALDRMAEDIGENQRLLTQREQRIRLLLDSTGEGIFGVDRQGLCTFANNMAAQLLGYASPRDLLGKNMNALTRNHADGTAYPAPAGADFDVHADDAGRHRDDEVFWRADGSQLPVEYSKRPIHSENEIIGSVVSFNDITLRKQAEAELRAERDFSHAILQTVASLVLLLDRSGRIVGFNKACEQLTGYTFGEIQGKYVWDCLLPPERIEEIKDMFNKHLAAARFPIHYQNEWLTRTRERRLIDWSNTALLDASGAVEFVIATGLDITHRHETEVEREKLVRELTARNAEMESFVYTISHDLKSPLITISGFSGLMEKDLQRGELAMAHDSLGEIRKAAAQMLELIEDLLQQSRSGRIMGETEDLDLGPFLLDIVRRFELKREEEQATLTIAPDLPVIRVDKARFTQLYQNLIDNAFKYRRLDVAPVIELGGFLTQEGELLLYVRDNSRGIKQAYLQRIFGLFQRVDTSVEGTGVGLAIAKRIAEVHGGSMWAESREGQGSTFWISLPSSVIVSNKRTKGI